MASLLHPASKEHLEQAASLRRQALLIEGEYGVGVFDAAQHFVSLLGATQVEVKPVDRATGRVDMENGKILTQLIRDLHDTTRAKSMQPQVVIIHHVDRMTEQSQGAFLKLLEEPRDNLHFVLLSEHTSNLLPTILSRVAKLRLQKISTNQSNELLDSLGVTEPKKRQQILFIADGLPNYIKDLAKNEDYFNAEADLMLAAKQLLQADTYSGLLAINKYKEDRQLALRLIDKSLLIARRMLKSANSDQLIYKIDSLLDAKKNLQASGNVRLALMGCVL